MGNIFYINLETKHKICLWCINDFILPKSIIPAVIYCDPNNVDTNNLFKISLGTVKIAESVTKQYSDIQILVIGLLLR